MTIHQAIASPGRGCGRQETLKSLIGIDEALRRIAAYEDRSGVAWLGCGSLRPAEAGQLPAEALVELQAFCQS